MREYPSWLARGVAVLFRWRRPVGGPGIGDLEWGGVTERVLLCRQQFHHFADLGRVRRIAGEIAGFLRVGLRSKSCVWSTSG